MSPDAKISKIVAYYRVSTKKQGQSGLGLEGQVAAVEAFRKQHGGKILAGYTEVETGKGRNPKRPELAKALAHARRSKALLVVAKLDRLARNVAFLSALMESAVDFVCCDNPHANKFTLHVLAAVAEKEAEDISERTKAALAAVKRRGKLLGSARPGHWEGREQARLRGGVKGRKIAAENLRAAAGEAYADILPEMVVWREAGETLQQIADRLNTAGHTTRRGKAWSTVQVGRVLERAGEGKSKKAPKAKSTEGKAEK